MNICPCVPVCLCVYCDVEGGVGNFKLPNDCEHNIERRGKNKRNTTRYLITHMTNTTEQPIFIAHCYFRIGFFTLTSFSLWIVDRVYEVRCVSIKNSVGVCVSNAREVDKWMNESVIFGLNTFFFSYFFWNFGGDTHTPQDIL